MGILVASHTAGCTLFFWKLPSLLLGLLWPSNPLKCSPLPLPCLQGRWSPDPFPAIHPEACPLRPLSCLCLLPLPVCLSPNPGLSWTSGSSSPPGPPPPTKPFLRLPRSCRWPHVLPVTRPQTSGWAQMPLLPHLHFLCPPSRPLPPRRLLPRALTWVSASHSSSTWLSAVVFSKHRGDLTVAPPVVTPRPPHLRGLEWYGLWHWL